MSRRYAIAGLIVLVLAASGSWAWRAAKGRAQEVRVPTTTPTRGEFVVSLLTEGTLESDDLMVVRTGKAPGELTMIVAEGAVVSAGDVFCSIEARDLRRELTNAELSYSQAREEIERARESAEERYENDQRSLEQSKKNLQVWEESVVVRTRQSEEQLEFDRAEAERLRLEYERARRMAEKGYQASAEADIAKAAYEAQQFKVEQSAQDLDLSRRETESERRQRESQLAATQGRLQASRGRIEWRVSHAEHRAEIAAGKLETITSALAETTILAPASGTVALFTTFQGGERRAWREGDQVSSGTPLGTISASKNMSVRSRVRESNIAALRKGQRAEIEFEALSGRKFTGFISSVGVVAREVWVWEDPTAEANARVFDVIIKVNPTKEGGLKPGLNARSNVILKRLPDTLFVPLEAVFQRDGKSYVYVKRGDRFERRQVKTGERNEVAVVIREGISEGETVALSDPTRRSAVAARTGA